MGGGGAGGVAQLIAQHGDVVNHRVRRDEGADAFGSRARASPVASAQAGAVSRLAFGDDVFSGGKKGSSSRMASTCEAFVRT